MAFGLVLRVVLADVSGSTGHAEQPRVEPQEHVARHALSHHGAVVQRARVPVVPYAPLPVDPSDHEDAQRAVEVLPLETSDLFPVRLRDPRYLDVPARQPLRPVLVPPLVLGGVSALVADADRPVGL